MTRINSAIPVCCLTDEHLLAEHREIKRLVFCLERAKISGSIRRIPKKFCLGTGHVLFFLNKMLFIRNRYVAIRNECLLRGFFVTDYIHNFDSVIGSMYWNDYVPSIEEKCLLVKRICDRIINSNKNTFHYFGNAISKEEACKMLLN